MFAPDRIPTRGRAAPLAALIALALLFAVAAVEENRALAETGTGKMLSSPRHAEATSTKTILTASTERGRYSDDRIRLLNRRLGVPSEPEQMEAELSSLQVLQLRFNRRYGPNSVASRSVRDRLELLRVVWESGRGSISR